MLGQLVDTAFGGSASGLVMELLKDRRLAPEEAERIRKMIDEAQEATN
jgi:predicted transcriptional regulator